MLAATTSKGGSGATLLIIYAVVLIAFYVFYMRPRAQRQKKARESARQVEVGDRVQTIGGVVGVITKRDENLVTISCASGAFLDFVPQAIARKIEEPTSPDTEGNAS